MKEGTHHTDTPKEADIMKKSVSVSNLTLDLWLDYVRPVLRDAGMLEEVPAKDDWHEYTAEVIDEATADEITHCMTVACFNAHDAGKYATIEEAAQLVYQMEVSAMYRKETAEVIATVRAALALKVADAIAATATATEEPAQTESKEEEKKMENTTNEAKKELLNINPHALQGLHQLFGYDFQTPHTIAHIQGRYTVNSALKAVGGADRDKVVTIITSEPCRNDWLNVVQVDSAGKIDIDIDKGWYNFGLDKLYCKKQFDEIRKNEKADTYIIAQGKKHTRKPQEKPFDTSARYEYIEGKDRKTGDGNGKSWISNITVRALDGSNRKIELTKDGNKETYSRIIYRRPDETRPQTHFEIIDKSGYLLPERRADLLRRADQLRKERAKAAYQATDNAEKVAELRAMVEQKKREFSEAIMNAANSEELRNAAHELYFKFMWTMSEYERFADKTARRDYVSIHAAESAYNHIKEELGKVVC